MGYREPSRQVVSCIRCRARIDADLDLCPACRAPTRTADYAELELHLDRRLETARDALLATAGLEAIYMLWVTMAGQPPIFLLFPLSMLGAWCLSFHRPWVALSAALYGHVALVVSIAVSALMLESRILLRTHPALAGGEGLLITSVGLCFAMCIVLANGVRAAWRRRDILRESRKGDPALAWLLGAAGVLAGLLGGILDYRG